jgi:hypothetical protein
MERKNQICEAGQQYLDSMDEFQRYHTYPRDAFIDGAKWSDEHPDSKHTYTKQQLIDMGFAFTINGDIVPPDQLNEDLKKYLEYQKRKFIEKGKEWIEKNFRSDGYFSLYYIGGGRPYTPKNIADDFCKAMEE